MNDGAKNKEQLLQEVKELRERVACLEASLAEQTRVEEALRGSERLYRTLAESSQDLIFMIDRDGYVRYVNVSGGALFGYRPEEMIGKRRADLFPPETSERQEQNLQLVFRSGKASSHVHWHHFPHRALWLDTQLIPIRSESGEVSAVLGISRDITEREQAAEALRASGEMYRALVTASPDAVTVTDLEGRVTEVSQRTLELHGFETPEELIGRSAFELIAPEDHDRAAANLRKTLEGGAVTGVEYTLARKDATRFIGELNAALVKDAHGRPRAFIATTREITERKRAEEALRESEERFRGIFENAMVGVYRTSPDGRILMANPALVRVLGYSSFEELAQRNLEREGFDTRHPRSAFKQRIEGEGKVIGLESAWVRRDGTTLFVRESARAVRSEAGKTLYYEGTVEDITERKRAEEALRESELRYRTVFQNAPIGIGLATPDGRVLAGNDTMLQMTGFSEEEIKEIRLADTYVEPENRAVLLERLRTDGFVRSFEVGLKRKDGTHYLASLTVILLTLGGEDTLLTLIQDITEKRKMEEELLKAQKLESIGLLAGGIAHDFNNLLTGILGNISLAKKNVPSEETVSEALAEAETAARRARGLVQRLLTFSKGGAPIRRTVRIAPMLREVAELAVAGSRVRCKLRIPDGLWAADADIEQIGQVVQNLLINARQATAEGGIIELHAENVVLGAGEVFSLYEGRYVSIAVRDRGTGIPPEHLPRIFDPYFTTREEGIGLGLAASYSIVNQHDGYIGVESEVGVGTTFTVYLPAAETEGPAPEEPHGELPLGQGKVLLMDDEGPILRGASRLLRECGYEVECALDGAEAIELYRRAKDAGRPFHAVILDLTVPEGMGGEECMKGLLEIDPHVKAIACSGHFDRSVVADFKARGFRGLVRKPYDVEELHEILSRIILTGGEAQ